MNITPDENNNIQADDKPPQQQSIRWEKWTAIGTVLMAICALTTSLWQSYAQRQHNELSVRPFLQFESNWDKKPDGKFSWNVVINNNGMGPANVVSSLLLVDNKPVESTSQLMPALGFLQDCFGSGHIHRFYKTGDRQLVVHGENAGCELTSAELQQLNRVRIQLVYESLYGETFVASQTL